MLRKVRIVLSALLFVLITFYMLDFAGILPECFQVFVRWQFIPAVISLSLGIVVFWIVLTLLTGRIYCSTLCPLGIFQDVIRRFSYLFKSKKARRYAYRKPLYMFRWTIFAACVISFALGFSIILTLFEPYSAYGRVVTQVFRPIYLCCNNLLEQLFTGFNIYTFYKTDIYVPEFFSFIIGVVTFLAVGFLAWRYGRIWCNTICPVGTILSVLSKYSLLRIRIDIDRCNGCGLCVASCKSSCINSELRSIDASRCVTCFNCIDACKRNALTYSYSSPGKTSSTRDDSKRRFLMAGGAALMAVPSATKAKINSWSDRDVPKYSKEIMPPGSISRWHMLRHCTSCHLCISKCPSKVLKPAWMEYGIEGVMQPVAYFEKGFCNYDCTVCGEVCPNGAIHRLTMEEKHLTQIGRVVFNPDYCIVRTEGTSCGACSEHCPTQAVSMIPYGDEGLTLPSINQEICVGCGGCEFICPSRPYAIHIEGLQTQLQAKPFDKGEKKELEIEGFGF